MLICKTQIRFRFFFVLSSNLQEGKRDSSTRRNLTISYSGEIESRGSNPLRCLERTLRISKTFVRLLQKKHPVDRTRARVPTVCTRRISTQVVRTGSRVALGRPFPLPSLCPLPSVLFLSLRPISIVAGYNPPIYETGEVVANYATRSCVLFGGGDVAPRWIRISLLHSLPLPSLSLSIAHP